MGNTIRRAVTKPIRYFNVDNRAQRVIAKDKPAQAPRHENRAPPVPDSVQEEIRRKILAKSDVLEGRLKDVKVISEGVNPEIKRIQDNLPQNRMIPAETALGFIEPKFVPKGKLSLTQALELLAKHQNAPKVYKAKDAAKEYNLDLRDAELIIEYYMPLTLIDPESKQDMARLGLKTKTEYIQESSIYHEVHKIG